MAYDQALAQRLRMALDGIPELVEKKMFGGIAFLIRGNMACGVSGEQVIVRISPDRYAEALAQPFVRPFDMTGRPMKGWVVVEREGVHSQEDLQTWLQRGVDMAQSLPPK
jgi:hypothetical protein